MHTCLSVILAVTVNLDNFEQAIVILSPTLTILITAFEKTISHLGYVYISTLEPCYTTLNGHCHHMTTIKTEGELLAIFLHIYMILLQTFTTS